MVERLSFAKIFLHIRLLSERRSLVVWWRACVHAWGDRPLSRASCGHFVESRKATCHFRSLLCDGCEELDDATGRYVTTCIT